MIWVETGINTPECGNGSNHQPRANEQNQSQGNLGHHKYPLQAVAGVAASASAFFERGLQIRSRCFQCGSETENDSRKQRDAKGKEKNAGVHRDFSGAWQRAWKHTKQSFGSEQGKHETGRAAETRQQDAFGEKLANQTRLTGSQRGANRKFTRA